MIGKPDAILVVMDEFYDNGNKQPASHEDYYYRCNN
jgi:hypothetical protein